MTKTMVGNPPVSVAKARGLSPRRRAYEIGMRTLIYLASGLVVALLIFLLGYIFYKGIPNLTWEFLTSEESVLKGVDGILPAIQNTIYVIVATLVVVLPLGVGAAIYLTEYASNHRLVTAIEYATETLAGIPSILYALVGSLIFCQTLGLGKTLIAGSMTLVIMTLPTIIRTTQESLKTVPQSYREGSLGLGAGKWHMIRTVVLPSSVDGIVTGCILAIGRIVGETAALMYTSGTVERIAGLTKSGSTLALHMYIQASEGLYTEQAYATSVVLLALVLLINLGSSRIAKMMMKGRE